MKDTIVNRTWYHHQLTNPQISFHQPIKISEFELKKDTVVPVTTGKRLYSDLTETFNSKGSRELVRSTRKRMRVVRGRKQT